MATSPESTSMALFCDFENVALGVRDAKYEKFDIKLVLERLLLKGSIVVKKAYCDWDRYKGFKATMHEANFELIEIPHVRQSGKNSADIRLVVDALDLCYTKSHVNTFVIISGDSDFSPLVSKLRENAKQVIGVGVKQSTSDLLIANCDEFIFYDDLVRETQRAAARREPREAQPSRRNDAVPQAFVPVAEVETPVEAVETVQEPVQPAAEAVETVAEDSKRGSRRNGRGGRNSNNREARAVVAEIVEAAPVIEFVPEPVVEVVVEPVIETPVEVKPKPKRTPARKAAAAKKPAKAAVEAVEAVVEVAPVVEVVPAVEEQPAKAPRKTPARRPARKKVEDA